MFFDAILAQEKGFQVITSNFRSLVLLGLGDHFSFPFVSWHLFRAMQPSAFTNQQRLLQSRFRPAYAAHEDDARSSTGSVNSWINVDTQESQPDPWAEDQSDEDGLPLGSTTFAY